MHVEEEHPELSGMRSDVLDTIENAERILSGSAGELLAVHRMTDGKQLVVVYRELGSNDGFVITAFLTRRMASLNRRQQIWPPLK
jgi:hypothetical protein